MAWARLTRLLEMKKKKVKLKAWLSLVLSSFRGKPGWNLPWKSGNSGFDWKIFNRKCACWLNEVLKGEWGARREREMGWKKMGWKRVACSFWIDSLSLRLNHLFNPVQTWLFFASCDRWLGREGGRGFRGTPLYIFKTAHATELRPPKLHSTMYLSSPNSGHNLNDTIT